MTAPSVLKSFGSSESRSPGTDDLEEDWQAPAFSAPIVPVETLRERYRHKRRKGKSLGTERLTRRELDELLALEAELRAEGVVEPMPKTRGECKDGPRPCVHVRCRYHLAATVTGVSDAVKLEHARTIDEVDLAAMVDTCALDVADRGPHGYTETGSLTGWTLERVRQVEAEALDKIRRRLQRDENIPPAVRESFARLMAAQDDR